MFYIPSFYTVESVTSGHPDKICDQISDAILDECLKQDPYSRVAVEVLGSHGHIVIGGEITTKADINPKAIALKVYKQIGHKDKVRITSYIVKQSPDISMGVNTGGAGDQGIMYGFATHKTKCMLPWGVEVAHSLSKKLEALRVSGSIAWLKPDGKTQVTIKNNRIKTVLISAQHDKSAGKDVIRNEIIKNAIEPVIGDLNGITILINPTGLFTIGGFEADTGLTGRKIMVDTYGGLIPHGGGCFSGKDPTKVDRSAAYMCRYVAKQLVRKGYARECLVSVSYAIGKSEPLMLRAVDEKGKKITEVEKYDFRPKAIIERLQLTRPIYLQTASYGHFTNNSLPWEDMRD